MVVVCVCMQAADRQQGVSGHHSGLPSAAAAAAAADAVTTAAAGAVGTAAAEWAYRVCCGCSHRPAPAI